MKKLLTLLLVVTSFCAYGQVLIDPAASVTTTRVNDANTKPVVASGTDTYTATLTGTYPTGSAFFTYLTDRVLTVKFTNAATSGPYTLNFNSEGAKTIKKFSAGSLVDITSSDISALQALPLRYNGTYFVIEGGAGGSSGITVGTTTVTSGTTGRVLYDNAGVVGEYQVSGSGSVAMTTNGVFTTPNLGTPSTVNLSNGTALPGTSVVNTPSGNISSTTAQAAINELDSEKQPVGSYAVTTNNLSDVNAASSRTNLGGTTTGQNLFTITDPSAITFLRVNADNSVSALSASSFKTAIGAGSVTSVTITQPSAGITVTNSGVAQTTTPSSTIALANDLAGLEGLSSTGIPARTATDTWALRTITGTSNQITVTNGDGVSGNPTLSLPSSLVLPNGATATTQSANDNSTKPATTAYVDNAVLGQRTKEATKYASTAALPSIVYSNGSSGVGATLTGVALAAISLDGNSPSLNDRVLIKNQASTFQNGIYTVTQTGSGIAVFILTRATDFDQAADIQTGDNVFVTSGNTLATTTWTYNAGDNPVMGTDPITFVQTAGQGSFTSGNGITITGVSIAIDPSVTVDKTTSQVLTNKDLTSGTNTFPTFNQNTTGSSASLTTARSIYGNNFDGTSALTQIIASTYGGTGNGFTKFSGPASSEKTFTLPNSSATILTDNAVVTLGQGGTNAALTASNGGIFYSTASAGAILAGTATANKLLVSGASGAPSWSTPTFPNASATSGKIIKSDGTNWVASTETYATPGSSGNILTSDGTNWTSAAPATPSGTWLLASGGTLTGVNTITSNTNSQIIFGGTWTATGNSQYHVNIGGTLTSLTGNSTLYGTLINTTMTAGATGHTLSLLRLDASNLAATSSPTRYALNALGSVLITTTSGTGASSLTVNNSTGSVTTNFDVQNTGTSVFKVSSGGSVTFAPSTATTAAAYTFAGNVQTATSGAQNIFTVSTSNKAGANNDVLSILNITSTMDVNAKTGVNMQGIYYNPTVTGSPTLHFAWQHTSGYVQWNSVLSPAQITSNQNDYNPTGLNTGGAPNGASILRVTTDASRNLTSVVGGATGRLLIIANVGSFDLVIKNDDGSTGTAANRFALNADITLSAGKSLMFWYDGTSSRWRVNSL